MVQRTTDRLKQKKTEIDTYQHTGKLSICITRCITVTNFSMGIKKREKSKVYDIVWLARAYDSSLHIKKYWESLEVRDKDHTISNRKAGDNHTIK